MPQDMSMLQFVLDNWRKDLKSFHKFASAIFVPCGNAILIQFLFVFHIHLQEMNLLVEADQPGNQLDDYISKLNSILTQKAAGILQLQNRLAQFQKRLKEHNVLVSTCGY